MRALENKLNFKFVQKSQLPLVKKWLSQPYIAKWIHGNGLDNTYKGLDKFLAGVTEPTQYWISYCDKEAFGFLITSKLNKSDSILEGVPLVGDEVFGLDIFICKESYLGKGFGKKMIKEIPFPIPLSVICSPNHMRKAVPAVKVRTVIARNDHPGEGTIKLPVGLFIASNPMAIPEL